MKRRKKREESYKKPKLSRHGKINEVIMTGTPPPGGGAPPPAL